MRFYFLQTFMALCQGLGAEFDSAAAGSQKTVRIANLTLSGANAERYAVSLIGAPTATADITAKTLTITGSFTVNDKQYDWMADAEIDTNNLALDGIIGNDEVSLDANAAFEDANAGTGKTVTLTGSTLTGADAANYVLDLANAPEAMANITKATGLQAPAAPTFQSKTSTSVTLTPMMEQEFSKDNGSTWQTSNVFTGLTPSTEYSFITRIMGNDNHEASPASEPLRVTTNASSYSGGGSGSTTPTPTSTPTPTPAPTPTPVPEIRQVNLDKDKMEELIQKVLEQDRNEIQIAVDGSEDNKADDTEIYIDKDAVKILSDNGVALDIETEEIGIQLPKETVQALAEDGKDLYFRITPINNGEEQTTALENAITAQIVQTEAGGGEVITLGTPMMIETNYQGYPTKLVFSLKGIEIPKNEKQRERFLSGLGVYITHSDGEQEFIHGTVIYDAEGNPAGLEIEVSKFSIFTMMSIINKAPVAYDLTITGKAEYGKKLTASYTYYDSEGNKEGKSLICWYRADNKKGENKKLVAEGELKYKVKKADQGKYLFVEITPVAKTGKSTGSTISAYVKVAANKAPQASGVKITGKTVVGSKLTVKYTYQDTESDKEGKTTIQWYRADSPDGVNKKKIKDANKSTYTLTKSDLGKYIIVEITPAAKTGTKTGTKTTAATKTVIKQK